MPTPLLKEKDAKAVRDRLAEELDGPVKIVFFAKRKPAILIPGQRDEDCMLCDETRQLLEEVSALSDRIALEVHDVEDEPALAKEYGIEVVPAFILQGKEKGRVRYLGIPSGYEFNSLIDDLADVSGGTTDLAERTKKALADLPADVHIQVFVTPTCPYCPGAARMAHMLAIESPRVTADVVEVSEFPQMARKFRVQGVPKTVINGAVELVGAQPEAAFLAAVQKAAEAAA